jgi:uncharacterized membrane protein YcaP (DUF421 family)
VELDLATLFNADTPPIEIFVRGTFTYLFVFVLLRIIVRQAAGGLNLADLLLIVMIADAAQNAMAGTYVSVTDGAILILTLTFWSVAIDWLALHVRIVGRWVHPPARLIVRDGVPLRRVLRQELITDAELLTHVHKAGAEDLHEVKRAWVEGSGEITVVLVDPARAE